jgi:hypothetical protein
MLQHNVEMDLKMRLPESGQHRTEAAEKPGVSLSFYKPYHQRPGADCE